MCALHQFLLNGTLDLPMLSGGYGTLVNQATALDQAFLSI